jgi:hypothetical protein
MYSAELGGRDDELRDDGGRGGRGDVAVVARSIVAISSVFETGLPQEEQKRTLFDNSIPQAKHLAMTFSRYSLLQSSGVEPQTSGLAGNAHSGDRAWELATIKS